MDATAWRIVLADNHFVFLDGLTTILTQRGHKVLAAVSTHAKLQAAVQELRPDLCIMETELQGVRDLLGIDALLGSSPSTRIVVLTADQDPEALRQALRGGISGYVHKSRNVTVLMDTLRRVAQGEIVIEGSFTRPRSAEVPPPAQLVRLFRLLTPRERECLALLAAGRDTASMSATLGVSRTTVRSHVQSALGKLGVHSRLEAASLVNRYHLLDRLDLQPSVSA